MGAGHTHDDDARPASRTAVSALLAVIVPLAVATLAALIWMWPAEPADAPSSTPGGITRLTGTIERIALKQCPAAQPPGEAPAGGAAGQAPQDPRRCGEATVQLTSGPDWGRTVTVALPSGPGTRVFTAGDDVIMLHMPDAAGVSPYQLSDHDRSGALWLVALAFALAVIAFGRWRGLTALGGLAITFALLLWFLIPAILGGAPPLLAAIVCAAAIMFAVLYLTHGFTVQTSIAVLGTLASLTLTALLATAAVAATDLTGVTDDSSFYLDLSYRINTQGLLLAGIVIGALGVLDDVTVTQAATVAELARADPGSGFLRLYRAAARVGRAHIASVINTIILAYAGASLPLLLLFSIGSQPLDAVLTSPVVAQEIVRSVAGTIGLIAAVPLTTALAAFVAVRRDDADEDGAYEDADPPYRPHVRRRAAGAHAARSDDPPPWAGWID
ncbi:MAG: YibE/F family protein [Streptosporangiales bacterium]|nr:YibE/F family protein [Streptosporangiales bacterium]